MSRRAGPCAAESELSWKSQTKILGCRGQVASRTERAQQGQLDLPVEPEALSPPLFAGMTWPELFFGVCVDCLLWRSLWRWDAGRQCLLWQGLLCKQWLENSLEGCQLSLPWALQHGREKDRPAVVLLGALGLLQNHLIIWHIQICVYPEF